MDFFWDSTAEFKSCDGLTHDSLGHESCCIITFFIIKMINLIKSSDDEEARQASATELSDSFM